MAGVRSSVAFDLVAGSIAGGAGATVGFPFDTIKVRLQSQHRPSLGPLGVLRHILSTDGVRLEMCTVFRVQRGFVVDVGYLLALCGTLNRCVLRQVRGLFRGLSPQLLGSTLETGVNYLVSLFA